MRNIIYMERNETTASCGSSDAVHSSSAITLLLLWAAVALGCQQRHSPSSESKASAVAAPSASTEPKAAADAASPPAVAEITGVLLITVDALRADQPWVGYDKVSTPNLSALAEEGVVYTRGYSLSNLTTASLNSLLASRYASELQRNGCTIARYSIPGSLAPTLQAAHVHTAAAHGHAIFVGDTAPSTGFDQWRVVRGSAGRLQVRGAVTGMDIAAQMLANFKTKQMHGKWFAWSHFVDPHHKYVNHPEYVVRSSGERAIYDSEVAYTDAAIGRLIDALKRQKRWGTTAMVVTADHGEAFGEHGLTFHGRSLYQEEIRVPLIVRVPGVKPKRVNVPRSTIDIAPTILELLGVAIPTSWRGVSLVQELASDRAPEVRPVIVDSPETSERGLVHAVIRDNVKVILTKSTAQVFDISTDPQERSALAPDQAASAIEQARRDLSALASVEATPCQLRRTVE